MATGKRGHRKRLKGRQRQAHSKYIGPTRKPCEKDDIKETHEKRNASKEKNEKPQDRKKGVYIYRRLLFGIISTVAVYLFGTGNLKYLWSSKEPIFHYCLVSLPNSRSKRFVSCGNQLDFIPGTTNEPIFSKSSECSVTEAPIVTQPSDAEDLQGAKSYETGVAEQEILHVWTQHQKEHANGINDVVITRLLDLYMSGDAEFPVELPFSSSSSPSIDNIAECEIVQLCTDEADIVESLKGLQGFDGTAPRTTPTGGSNDQTHGNDQQTQTTAKQVCREQSCHVQVKQNGGNVGGSGDGEDPGKNGSKSKRIGGCKGDATEVKEEAKKHDTEKNRGGQEEDGDNICQPPHVIESENFERAQSLLNTLDCCVCNGPSQGDNHVYVVLPCETVVCSGACAARIPGRMVMVRMREMRQHVEHLRQLVESHAEDADIAAALENIAGSLDCPVCRDLATSPMTICNQGHITCAGCSFRLPESRCPICRQRLTDYVCLPEKLLNALNVQRATSEELQQWYCQVLRLDTQNPLIDNILEVVERNSEASEPPISGPPSNSDGDIMYIPSMPPPPSIDDDDLETYDFLAAGSEASAVSPRESPNQQSSNFYYARCQRVFSPNDNQGLTPELTRRDPHGAMLNEQPRVAVATMHPNIDEDDLEIDGGLDEDEEEIWTFMPSEEQTSKDDSD